MEWDVQLSLCVGANYIITEDFTHLFFHRWIYIKQQRECNFRKRKYVINMSQLHEKVNEILFDPTVAPYFIENLNQYMYWYILETYDLQFLNTLERKLWNNLFWQQDAYRAHSTVRVWEFFDHQFPKKKISSLAQSIKRDNVGNNTWTKWASRTPLAKYTINFISLLFNDH